MLPQRPDALPRLASSLLAAAALLAGAGEVAGSALTGLSSALAQARPPTPQSGEGPFERLIVRGVTIIDGTGAPPYGPADVVIEGNRIVAIRSGGAGGSPIGGATGVAAASHEIDGSGMYALPGFVDMHGHIRDQPAGLPAEYVYKLWLAHGITTTRDAASHRGIDWTLEARAMSAENAIVAPRIFVYVRTDAAYLAQQDGWRGGDIVTPEDARAFVRWAGERGVDGFKTYGFPPAVLTALIDEAKDSGLGVATHLSQLVVAEVNALSAARMGLTTLEHWYGLPEALLERYTVQDFRRDYNYNNEDHRFRGAGQLWAQAAPPGSERWNAVMDEMLALGLVLVPTFNVYEANRDLERSMRARWHDYMLPGIIEYNEPNRDLHGSWFYDWTSEHEVEWKENYRLWMAFVNEYKNRGGRVAAGTDSGVVQTLYGFSFVRELELLREAGFHPLELLRSATLDGARTLFEPKGEPPPFGAVRAGMLADLVLVEENPLDNLKVLYGDGHLRLNGTTNRVEQVGGVHTTIKDGIVYDAKALVAEVEHMVETARAEGSR